MAKAKTTTATKPKPKATPEAKGPMKPAEIAAVHRDALDLLARFQGKLGALTLDQTHAALKPLLQTLPEAMTNTAAWCERVEARTGG